MFELIDHIGVATEDLDAALRLYEGSFAMPVAHRETVEEQGVEAILLDTMFDLPSMDGVTEVVVDKEVVEGRKEPVRVVSGDGKKKEAAA